MTFGFCIRILSGESSRGLCVAIMSVPRITIEPSVKGLLYWVWTAVMLLSVPVLGQNYPAVVSIQQGEIRGLVMKTNSGREFYAFMGIPYATPPLGPLRFKPPVRHPGWGGLLDATEYRSSCPQIDARGRQIGSEDCLFLNVFTPSIRVGQPRSGVYRTALYTSSSDRNNGLGGQPNFPVMVFIHGEDFARGDSQMYGPQKLLDKGVVLVTFNYRLGLLGFLSTDDETARGNWGLLDQKMVLDWVRDNILAFGGDPDAVTLFGQGSGAASIALHLVSPLTQGLLNRVILQSGSALCGWAVQRKPLQNAREMALQLGCPTSSAVAIVECLRRKPEGELLRAQQTGKILGNYPLRFGPVIERLGANRFLPDEPSILLERGNYRRVPMMTGVNSADGSFIYPISIRSYTESIRNDPEFVRESLVPRFLDAATPLRGNVPSVVQAVMFSYFNEIDTTNVTQVVSRLVNMSSDALFVTCMDNTAKTYARLGGNTFVYVFEHRGENTMLGLSLGPTSVPLELGATHGDELLYLFNINSDTLRPPTYLDNMVSGRMITLWTDFAKYGEAPQFVNYEYPTWERLSPDSMKYYRIGRDLRLLQNYRQREVDLWSRHLPLLAGVDSPFPTSSQLTKAQMAENTYRTLAWAMVAVSVALFILVIVLCAILYNQRRSQSFNANPENQSRISGSTLY